jgi:hypothetical protein
MKNDHLGFEIVYVFDGVVRKYRPDFLMKLTPSDASSRSQRAGLTAEPSQAS